MMNWRLENKLFDCKSKSFLFFEKALKSGLIVFFSKNASLRILTTNKHKELCTLDSGIADYFTVNKFFLIMIKNKIYEINLNDCSNSLFYKTDQTGMRFFDENYLLAGSVFRNPRRMNQELIELKTKRIVFSWTDERGVIGFSGKNPIFHKIGNHKLLLYDLTNKTEKWSLHLDKGFAGVRYKHITEQGELYIQRRFKLNDQNLVKINLENGEILWEKEKAFHHYCYDQERDKLYGITGLHFHIIDGVTGEEILKKPFNIEGLKINPQLAYYADGFLYFSGKRDKQPVIGAVDVETGEMAFIQEVEVAGEKSFRAGLDKPIVVGNRLYVHDSSQTLHIYEREQ